MPFPLYATVANGDNFNGPDQSPLAGNWRSFANLPPMQRLANRAEASGAFFSGSYFANRQDYTDTENFMTVAVQDNTAAKILKIRLTPATGGGEPIDDQHQNGYQVSVDEVNAAEWLIQRIDNSVNTTLGTFPGFALASGDGMGFQAIGSRLSCWRKVAAGAYVQVGTVTDATYGYGKTGIVVANDSPIFDDYGLGGVFTVGVGPASGKRRSRMTSW